MKNKIGIQSGEVIHHQDQEMLPESFNPKNNKNSKNKQSSLNDSLFFIYGKC